MNDTDGENSINSGPNRRRFLGGLGGAAALTALAVSLPERAQAEAPHPSHAPKGGPAHRDSGFVTPVAVSSVTGDVENSIGLINGGSARLSVRAGGTNPRIILDYGTIVGGLSRFAISKLRGHVTLKAVYSQSLPYLLPGGDGPSGTPPTTDAAFGNIAFVGDAAGAQLSRTEVYPLAVSGVITAPLVQGGQRFQAIELEGSGSIELARVGFVPGYRLDTPDDPSGGAFSCSDTKLNQIWADGLHTANVWCVPAGQAPPMWIPTSGGLKVQGDGYSGYWPGGQWTDYVVSFAVERVLDGVEALIKQTRLRPWHDRVIVRCGFVVGAALTRLRLPPSQSHK